MSLTQEKKKEILASFQKDPKDTGSSQVQIALLTTRIVEITEHLKSHKNDFHSRRGLLKLVSHRRSLLGYLKKKRPTEYLSIVERLNLRR